MAVDALTRFARKPGPGRVIGLAPPYPRCPLCTELVARIRLEDGLEYRDVWFDTYRFGTWEELGGRQERWESVTFVPDFDRILVEPCGHVARGPRALHWRTHLVAATLQPALPAGPARSLNAGPHATPRALGVAPVRVQAGPAQVTVPLIRPRSPVNGGPKVD